VFQSKGNSHIDAHFFTDMQSGAFGQWVSQQTNWAINTLFYTYIKLRKGTSPQLLETKLPAFMDKYAGKDLKAAGLDRKLFLQAVPDIHLHSDLAMELSTNGSITYLYILGCIAGFILLLACINFMNLSTARSAKRAKEVGMRKVMGAYKTMIIKQFLSESLLLSLVSFVIAGGLTILLLPLFNHLTGKSLHLSSLADGQFVGSLFALILLTGLIAGSYPAFYLSSFQACTCSEREILQ
jgi:putative ABC transport system permease protein